MFGSIKKVFILAITFFSCNALKCVSMNNQECKVRPEIKNIDSNEPSFSPYSIFGINIVEVVTISMIHLQNYMFLMFLKR